MEAESKRTVSEDESRKLAEASRERDWLYPSFLRSMFLGKFRFDLLYPFPRTPERPEFREFCARVKQFFIDKVDPVAIDAEGEYPPEVIQGLAEMGMFGLNIATEYGGLGLSKTEFCQVMELISSYEGNLLGMLSPHQSVGVPECLKLFGTNEQKKRFLPECAKGAISAFALTEPDVGSDPARLSTSIDRTPEGDYILNGTKLWCTNGTMARYIVVMGRHTDTGRLSAIIVDTQSGGFDVTMRCRFMGLKALANGVLEFRDVRVPKENLIAQEGMGLKIALTALNGGRLSVPAGAVGTAKACLEVARTWARERVQWGKPIGEHEAIAQKIARMASHTYAMETIVRLACEMADSKRYDIRLEAAAAKEWNTCRSWEIADELMQIRGGRGYETEQSLAARGERPMPAERIMRDIRVTKIFEGASEVMHLFMAREGVDPHLKVAGTMLDPEASLSEKLACLPKAALFYAVWYPSCWLGWGHWPRYAGHGPWAGHLRFIDRRTRKLGRQLFHGMLRYQGRLQHKQMFLFRWVDIAVEMFAMAAVIGRVRTLEDAGDPEAKDAAELADLFCRQARRKVDELFRALWRNEDAKAVAAARHVLDGKHAWLERNVIGLDEWLPWGALHEETGKAPEGVAAKL